jgi:hypothetical protein
MMVFFCIMKMLILYMFDNFLYDFFGFSHQTLHSLHVNIFGFLGFQRKKEETFNLLRNIFQYRKKNSIELFDEISHRIIRLV